MASSTFTFVDQNNKPVWGLATRIARNNGGTDSAEDERYPDRAGHTTFLEVKKVLPADNGHTLHINYNEGLNPDWAAYEKRSIHFADIEDPSAISVPIVVKHSGGSNVSCPVNFDKDQFRAWFTTLIAKYNEPLVTTAAMVRMQPDLVACGFEWQNMCRNSSEWRPRIHQPPFLNGPCSGSTHDVDLGDFGKPWVFTFRY